ncbi:MAG: sodium:dicarboxylate symporter [Edaphobacter sp.]|nr:sodium:dicarboxylate symporter [Edaphobacter sp.]
MLKTNLERIMLLLATLLMAVGIALGTVHEPFTRTIALGLRWVAIALLTIDASRRRSLTVWIFVAMIAGAELGFDAPAVAINLRVLSDIFLRLIKTIVAPLILATLITGIAGHGDLKSVGRMGIKSLIYFEVATTLALVLGLVAINLSHAGVGLSMSTSPPSGESVPATAATHWQDSILHIFPENIAKSVAEGQILQVAVFAIFFGIALASLSREKRAPMLNFFSSLSEVMFKFTNVVMYFAPIGVGAAMAFTVGQMGIGILLNLGKLLLTLYVALIAFALLVLLPSALLFRVPLRRFLSAVTEPATIAFATSSSEAALPRAMEAMEALGVPRRIVAFVIPAGYSFNSTGSTLYLAVASIFVAQAAGIHLSLSEQVLMLFTLMVTSKGFAGVPRSALVLLFATAATFHLPTEPIFVILGIDAVADMGRTAINVAGNCLASVVVAKWEGAFEEEPASQVVLQGMAD